MGPRLRWSPSKGFCNFCPRLTFTILMSMAQMRWLPANSYCIPLSQTEYDHVQCESQRCSQRPSEVATLPRPKCTISATSFACMDGHIVVSCLHSVLKDALVSPEATEPVKGCMCFFQLEYCNTICACS